MKERNSNLKKETEKWVIYRTEQLAEQKYLMSSGLFPQLRVLCLNGTSQFTTVFKNE